MVDKTTELLLNNVIRNQTNYRRWYVYSPQPIRRPNDHFYFGPHNHNQFFKVITDSLESAYMQSLREQGYIFRKSKRGDQIWRGKQQY